ncbi:cNMP binding protein, partial [Oryctes borbonicus]
YLYATSLYLRHGISNETGYVMLDIIVTSLIILSGYFMFCFIISELTASIVLDIKKEYAHQDEILVMQGIMKRRLVGTDLYTRCINILHFNWRFNEGAEIQGANGIFNDGSEMLKTEIINDRITSVLKQVPLFTIFSEELIRCISLNMQVTIVPEETPLVEIGSNVWTVYVILRGYCLMKSDLPGDRDRNITITLKQGDMLAPIEMLHGVHSVSSIKTLTAVEILQMPSDTFKELIKTHRMEYGFIQKALEEDIGVYNNLLQKKVCRLPQLRSVKPSQGKIDSFEYEILQEKKKKKKKKADYQEYLKHLGERWSWLKYILLRHSIDPWGRFFICWEIIRNIVIVVDVLVILLSISVLDDYQNINDNVVAVSRATAAIDMYIRFHCEYYNEEGILVTHPLYTAKYYLRHSFLMDFGSALPLTKLNVAMMFGTNYAIQIKFLYRLLTRPIQLYRIIHALSLFQHQMHWSKGSIIMKAKYTIVLVVILGICANVLLLLTCKLHTSGHKVIDNCSGHNWMSFSPVRDQFHNTYVLFLQSMYFIIALFGNSISGMYKAVTAMEMRIFIALTFGLHMLKIVLMAKFTSSTIGGNVNLSIYQSRMKQFLKFAKEVAMNNHLIKELIAHNEYIWKETQGTSINAVGNKLDLYLRVKFLSFLYESTLRSTSLFVHLSQYALRRLTLRLEEVHFKKGAEIIRYNDVQSKLYIVYKGSVKVSVANMVISTLNEGGIFGCFSRAGELRHTITVTATVHTILLAIDSRNFHRVIPWEEEHIKDVMKDIRLLKLEYLDSFVSTREYHIEKKRHTGLFACYEWLIVKVNEYIDQESFLYWLWEYMLNVHFSVISSLIMLTEMCLSRQLTDHIAFVVFLYGMDVIFLSKV